MFYTQVSELSQLQEAASLLLKAFPDDRIFALYGSMGAGKTTFIKAICKELGSNDYVTSPSFALINEYSADERGVIYHFDFYRIKKLDEAYDLGYEDYIYSGSYCLIEWPEMIEPLLPERIVEVRIRVINDNVRLIEAEKV